ncbi:hypothetical protein H0B56_17145 [Haloechinothrix sp. YIM 98757]|uniref:Uncharacterized protein n=1 Tax=Haloechinothrix aidingensis TaxID=2752311 RepID=A0A838ADB0_9PSEU|nr:hypothetical protein [Haloechinothrix aidingensis]MBA0127279.1 hypothetical protein [Haloechinothrix aidingensis]
MVGGGAAVNSGMDFQARVGALALVSMLADVVDLGSFGLGGVGEVPREVRFETANAVDDITLELHRGRVMIQAKNSITLSSRVDSEIAKFVRQVVAAHRDYCEGDRYVLAVSPAASTRIRQELKKLCHAYRLIPTGAGANPLTKSERETMDVLRDHVFREYEIAGGVRCDARTLEEILRAVYVETIDVSEEAMGERMALTALSTVTRDDPLPLWHSLVATCLSLSRDRVSIDQSGLTARFDALLTAKSATGAASPILDKAEPLLVLQGGASMGREVVLAEDAEGRVCLAEFRRFDETGARRLHFIDGFVHLAEGVRWRVLRRTATYSGMVRELEDGLSTQISDKAATVFETNLGDLDNTPFAQAHAAAFDTALETAARPMVCLVCGRVISQNRAYSIEVDEANHPYQVGIVHRGCLHPTHRVVGVLGADSFPISTSLIDFDISTWLRQLRAGQAAWSSQHPAGAGAPLRVAWNPANSAPTTGGWAVEYDLADGSTRYVLVRGHVHRGSRQQARQTATQLNKSLQKASAKGDPLVYGLRGYGQRSVVISAEDPNPPEVLTHRAVQVTEATVSAYSVAENYYAPLFYLNDPETGELFTILQMPILLTNPLRFDEMTANWKTAGVGMPASVSATVIATDEQFDLFMTRASTGGAAACVDPVLASDGQLVAGFLVTNLNDLVRA